MGVYVWVRRSSTAGFRRSNLVSGKDVADHVGASNDRRAVRSILLARCRSTGVAILTEMIQAGVSNVRWSISNAFEELDLVSLREQANTPQIRHF